MHTVTTKKESCFSSKIMMVLDFDEEIKKLSVEKWGFVETMPILCSDNSFCEQQDDFFVIFILILTRIIIFNKIKF